MEGERNNERYMPSRCDPSSHGLQNAAMARNETGVRGGDNRQGHRRNLNIAKEAVVRKEHLEHLSRGKPCPLITPVVTPSFNIPRNIPISRIVVSVVSS